MDQEKVTGDMQELKTLLREVLQMQELLLHRIEKLETILQDRR